MATVTVNAAPTTIDGLGDTLTAPTALAGTTFAAADTINLASDSDSDSLAGAGNGKVLLSFNVTTAGTLAIKMPASPRGRSAGPYHRRAGADTTITFPGTGRFLLAVELYRYMDDNGDVQLVSGTAAGAVQVLKLPFGF